MPSIDTTLRSAIRLRNSPNGNARFRLETDHGTWNTPHDSALSDIVKALAGNGGSTGLDIPVTVKHYGTGTEVTDIHKREPKPRLWAVQAQVTTTLETTGWSASRQLPTFYLDPAVQGITDEHGAYLIAEEILSAHASPDDLSITVAPIH